MMKALTMPPGGGVPFMEEIPLPVRKPGEALIKVLRAGVCNTDLEIMKGYSGFSGTMGHEFVGEVRKMDEVDETDKIKVGTRVVGELNITCNHCSFCAEGGVPKRNHCLKRTVLGIVNKDGVFADYVTLPIANLHRVPDEVSNRQAAFVEPLAAAYRIIEQNVISESDDVAIIGDGKLGLLISEVLSLAPHRKLIHFGKHREKLALTPAKVETVLVAENVESEYENKFHVVVEASGTPGGLMMAATMTKPLGTVVLKSTCAAGAESLNTAPFVVKELKVVGSRCGNFPMALEALRSHTIDVEKFLVKVYPFEQGEQALEHAAKKGTLKIQMRMTNDGQD